MNRKYVIQAFELKLKGRFDVLHKYYGEALFKIPAQIMVIQVKDELGIDITEGAIYNLKKRLKKQAELIHAREIAKEQPPRPRFFGE